MGQVSLASFPEPALVETERLRLYLPHPHRAAAMRDYALRNLDHLKPWSPPPRGDLASLDWWLQVVAEARATYATKQAVRLWLEDKAAPGVVIGSVGFSQIFHGPFCAAVLGYAIDQSNQGRGLMREAVAASANWMFETYRLHRIAANYRPENTRSAALLAALGFQIEGFAKHYLYIDGAWRDHVLTARTNPHFKADWLIDTPRA